VYNSFCWSLMLTSGCPSINMPVLRMLQTRSWQVVQWWPLISQNILPSFPWLTFHMLCETSNDLVRPPFWHHTQACYHCCDTVIHFFLLWPNSTLSLKSFSNCHIAIQPQCHTDNYKLYNSSYISTPVCKTDFSQLREDDSKLWYCHVRETAKAWNDNPHL